MSDFAREQLSKYGWVEGKGLGKYEDGISKPIKAKIKCNRMGVGCNPGDEYTFNWWEHVYDRAAANITVQSASDDVSIKSNEIPNTLEKSNCHEGKYANFRRGSLVDNCNGNNSELRTNNRVSDEEIFRKCKGMTAHRAARHGLPMNGKLRRLELQERSLDVCRAVNFETSMTRKRKRMNEGTVI